ncbi:MAG: succinyl-diaminopimelate desuccinylase [Pseudomonadales bacterium]
MPSTRTTEPLADAVLALTQTLVQCPSVTPDDGGCQRLIAERLAPLGFEIEHLRYGAVDNLWATWGDAGPWVIFAGHTDVVPTGPRSQWSVDPFAAQIKDGFLYGRGAADMKASLAAMVVACEQLLSSSTPRLQIGFLITSDEEGPAVDGTVRVVELLRERGQCPDYCIVGEPSSSQHLGDVVRNGRRGSLNAHLTAIGKQGHVAYPELASNPIHALAPALAELANTVWDEGNDYYPATSLQISNINGGTGASNVVPGQVEAWFNFRFCTEQTAEGLKQRVAELLAHFDLHYELEWTLSGEPFLTPRGTLTAAVSAAIAQVTGAPPALSTSGGTSDGRFIAPLGVQVVELGPCNATIHKIDECVRVSDLAPLAQIYQEILIQLESAT